MPSKTHKEQHTYIIIISVWFNVVKYTHYGISIKMMHISLFLFILSFVFFCFLISNFVQLDLHKKGALFFRISPAIVNPIVLLVHRYYFRFTLSCLADNKSGKRFLYGICIEESVLVYLFCSCFSLYFDVFIAKVFDDFLFKRRRINTHTKTHITTLISEKTFAQVLIIEFFFI